MSVAVTNPLHAVDAYVNLDITTAWKTSCNPASDNPWYLRTRTANQMLQGKQYASAIQDIHLAHEALTHLFLTAAEDFATMNSLQRDSWSEGLKAGYSTAYQQIRLWNKVSIVKQRAREV